MNPAYFAIGARIINAVITGIPIVEHFIKSKGKDKEDALIDLVKFGDHQVDDVVGRELLADSDVEAAARGVTQAVVAFHNIVAAKRAARRP